MWPATEGPRAFYRQALCPVPGSSPSVVTQRAQTRSCVRAPRAISLECPLSRCTSLLVVASAFRAEGRADGERPVPELDTGVGPGHAE